MLVDGAKVVMTFKKVKQIQEQMREYCIAPDRAKLSVEDLQRVISTMYSLQIEKREVAFEGSYVRGVVERYPGRARILIRKDQEEDWLRYTAVKELCQVAICEKEDWSVEGTTTLENLLDEARLDKVMEEKDRQQPPHPTQSEKLAEVAAIELMYPFIYRDADLAAIAAKKTTYRAIAVHFAAPEFVIGWALSARHHAMATEFWKTGDLA